MSLSAFLIFAMALSPSLFCLQHHHQFHHLHGISLAIFPLPSNKKSSFLIPGRTTLQSSKPLPMIRAQTMIGTSHRKKHDKFFPESDLYRAYRRLEALCQRSQLKRALAILQVIDSGEIPAHFKIYDTLLRTCIEMKALKQGRQVHTHMISTKNDGNPYLATRLVTLYSICGSLPEARRAFEKVARPDMRLWNAMIRACVRNGVGEQQALVLYRQMRFCGIAMDEFTFSCVLKACGAVGDLTKGMEIHGTVIKRGFEWSSVVGGALLTMYGKCGNLEDACQMFDEMPERDLVSRTTMIAAFGRTGRWREALGFFSEIQREGMKPTAVVIRSILKACCNAEALRQGKEIHAYVVRNGFDCYNYVANAIVDMYCKSRCLKVARQLFDKMSERDTATWTVIVGGYAINGCANEALEMFRQMQLDGVKPSSFTLRDALLACADSAGLKQGKEIHAFVIRSGFESDETTHCALASMYSNCGCIDIAESLTLRLKKR